MSLSATLNANAKASVNKQRIRVLENPTTDQRAWINDVVRKAKLIGAAHSIKVKWLPRDEVDLSDQSDPIVPVGNGSQQVQEEDSCEAKADQEQKQTVKREGGVRPTPPPPEKGSPTSTPHRGVATRASAQASSS